MVCISKTRLLYLKEWNMIEWISVSWSSELEIKFRGTKAKKATSENGNPEFFLPLTTYIDSWAHGM
jgi:hypothetical protein